MQHLDTYLAHLRDGRGVSPHTLRNYRSDLLRFCQSLGEDVSESIDRLAPEALRDYVGGLLEAGLDRSTVARHASSLRGFFRFLLEAGLREEDPSTILEVPRTKRALPRVLSQDEVSRLLAAPGGAGFQDVRDRAMLEVLYSAGVRVSELVALDVDDLDLEGGTVQVKSGKGAKGRLALLGSYAVKALGRWLPLRSTRRDADESGALFLNTRGGRLTDRSVRRMFEARLIQAELPASVTPHTLRHSFATHMLESGAGLKEVQELLGHRHLSSTQVYTHVSPEHLRTAYERAHPRVQSESPPVIARRARAPEKSAEAES